MPTKLVEAEVGGERAREGISTKVEEMKVVQTTEARRDVPSEPIRIQVSNSRREDTGEPMGWQLQCHHASAPAPAPHTLPPAVLALGALFQEASALLLTPTAAALKASNAASSSSAVMRLEMNMQAESRRSNRTKGLAMADAHGGPIRSAAAGGAVFRAPASPQTREKRGGGGERKRGRAGHCISFNSVSTTNSFVDGNFEKLASPLRRPQGWTSVRLVLHGKLSKHAVFEGTKVVAKLLFVEAKVKKPKVLEDTQAIRDDTLNWLKPRSMATRLVHELKLAGSRPEKSMEAAKTPEACGDVPAKPIGAQIKGERTPVSPWDGRLSATTRRCVPWHLTPSQLQYSPLALPFQEASASPLPSVAATLKASSAASSPSSAAAGVENNMQAVISRSNRTERRAMAVQRRPPGATGGEGPIYYTYAQAGTVVADSPDAGKDWSFIIDGVVEGEIKKQDVLEDAKVSRDSTLKLVERETQNTRKVVVLQNEYLEMLEPITELGGHAGAGAQVDREKTREGVAAQVESMEVAQMTQARRDIPAETIGSQIKGERTPVSPRDGRLNATTRRCLPWHLTPSQLQYPPLALPFQEASALLLPLTAAALKASSAVSSAEKNMDADSSSSKHTERIPTEDASAPRRPATESPAGSGFPADEGEEGRRRGGEGKRYRAGHCILSKSMSTTNSFSRKPTIASRGIQTSVWLVLPGELAKHAVSEGTKVVASL
nr:unnamed protein product [Digitaria exilis]